MANPGVLGLRGYIFQSLIAIIESLEKDDWDEIKVEPETKNDNVDIIFYRNKRILSAIQVKSSINPFERVAVANWLKNLREDAFDAKKICLFLVGDTFTPSCENYISEHPDEIKKIPFENLQVLCNEKLVEYIRTRSINTGIRVNDLDFISDALFANLLKNSIAKEPISRADFEEIFQKALPITMIPKCLTPIPRVNHEVGLVGRDNIKKSIQELLKRNGSRVLVCGLGGIGKTAVMQYLCNDIKAEGKYVAWIKCGNSLKEDLLHLRMGLRIPQSDNADIAYKKIITELSTNRVFSDNFFLFLDNLYRFLTVEELEILNRLQIHVMVTSRFNHYYFDSFSLYGLDQKSALDMFYGYYLEGQKDKTRNYEDAALKIIRSVNNHTLLIELLAKAACERGGTLEDFWYNLKNRGIFDVFTLNLNTKHDKNQTIEEYITSLFGISGLTVTQQHILKLFTILTPEKEIYYKICEWAAFDMAEMDHLVDLGWLEQGGLENGYHIHQIVRDSLTRQLAKRGEQVRLEEYGELLDKVADTSNYLSVALTYEIVKERIVLPEDIANHLVNIYQTDREPDKKLSVKVGALFNNLAEVYYRQGFYEKALDYYRKALSIRELILGNEHPDTAHTYNNLASIFNNLGKYEEALKYCHMAFDIQKRMLGDEHPETALTYNNLASIFNNLGKYEEALKYCHMAFDIQKRMLGDEHPETALTYNNLASIFNNLGKYEEALECCDMASAIQERVLKKNHPDLAYTYNNLASIFNNLGEREKALEYCEKALTILEHSFAPGHPYTALTEAFLQKISSKIQTSKWLNDFFHENSTSYASFASLQQFIEKKNLDVSQTNPDDGLSDIFRFTESRNTKRQKKELQDLLELLWKLYLVDSDHIEKVLVPVVPNANQVIEKKAETIEEKTSNEKNLATGSEDNEDSTSQYKSKPSALEVATELVLKDFESWWEKEANRSGLTFSIEKYTKRQGSGFQFGYDVGLNSKIGELKYRLRFECKNYSSNISDSKNNISDLSVSRYAYNLFHLYGSISYLYLALIMPPFLQNRLLSLY